MMTEDAGRKRFYLPDHHPLLWDELRRHLRGSRLFLLLFTYATALSAVFVAAYFLMPFNGSIDALPKFGRMLWHGVTIGQFVLLLIICPALFGGSISAERERGALDALFLTPLTPRALIYGKFWGGCGQVMLILLAGSPVLSSMVVTFGGVSLLEVCGAYALLLACAAQFAGVSMLASCLAPRHHYAMLISYLLLLLSLPFCYTAILGLIAMGESNLYLLLTFVQLLIALPFTAGLLEHCARMIDRMKYEGTVKWGWGAEE